MSLRIPDVMLTMKTKVWVIFMRWNDDEGTHGVYTSYQAAQADVLNWVHQFWDEVAEQAGSTNPPDDPEEAIALYFQCNEDEWYEITEHEITFEPEPEQGVPHGDPT